MSDLMYPVIGGRIKVPFHSKSMIGIVVAFYTIHDISGLNFKHVTSLIDSKSIYTNVVLDLLIWINKNYHCPIGKLFFSVLPKFLANGYIIKNNYITRWSITKKGFELDINQLKNKKKQLYTITFLKKNSVLSTELNKYCLSKFILKKLEKQKLCKIDFNYQSILHKKYIFDFKKKIFLNKKLLIVINNILVKKNFSSWLLTRVNLYVKVKFYLGLIREILRRDLQILILVPYFKYINVIATFLKTYFNVSIGTIHSQLTNTQYLKNWIKTQEGENSVIIGTNNSVFLPFLKLGIIIVFDEHSLNYKNINECRYNAKDISILRAYKENIPIILDSETPSLKTLYNILNKKCFYIKLHKYNKPSFKTNIINLKKDKIKFGLSLTLINEINNNFQKKQVLLIFNKFSLFFFVLSCDKCNWIFECTSCHNYFEINQYDYILFCKFCLIKIKKPIFCYNCGSYFLKRLMINIESIKNKIKNIFPKRLMFFLLNKKNVNKDILNTKIFKFFNTDPYIIITTEEIVQNYFFPYVRLIGLIRIDNHFMSFQFRETEYFAQFYINLSQLINNRIKLIKVLIQTSLFNNSDLKNICYNGYFSFANKMLKIRKHFLLPPWSFQSIIYCKSVDINNNIIFLNLIRKLLKIKSKKYNSFLWLVGPTCCFTINNNKKNYYQLFVQCASRSLLKRILNESISIINLFSISRKVKWFIDIDPN